MKLLRDIPKLKTIGLLKKLNPFQIAINATQNHCNAEAEGTPPADEAEAKALAELDAESAAQIAALLEGGSDVDQG